jgi:hypothetical protein
MLKLATWNLKLSKEIWKKTPKEKKWQDNLEWDHGLRTT